ncbi:MAG: hypothetical protein N4A71_00580 [Carboxylicivirga sp.]|nr:hypothetical protein [Carboxylicivirga sp.]
MQHLKLYISLFILLINTTYLLSNNTKPISEQSFSCELDLSNFAQSLKAGTQSLIIDLKKSQQNHIVNNTLLNNYTLTDWCKDLLSIQQPDSTPNILVITGDVDQDTIQNKLQELLLERYHLTRQTDTIPGQSINNHTSPLLLVFEDEITKTSSKKINNNIKYHDRFTKDPLDKLVLFTSEKQSVNDYTKDCIDAWNTTGKRPNFIYSKYLSLDQLNAVADSLNKIKHFAGEVVYENYGLNEISWNHAKSVISPARFSFPMFEYSAVYKPNKHGYKISPGEVIHHTFMSDEHRIFNAYDMLPEDDLVYDLTFDGAFLNKLEANWSGSLIKGAEFIEDDQRGTVLHFSETNSFIDYGRKNTLDFNAPISISVWVKPDRFERFMSIIGFGSSFSFKLRYASPDFTTATIQDHIVNDSIQAKQWTHLAVVFSPDYTVRFFINGQMADEIATSEINPNNHALVIGNNVWSEQFYGSIDDLKIWNRGLSDQEITQLYLQSSDTGNYKVAYLMLILLVIATGVIILMVRKRKPTTIPSTPINQAESPVEKEEIALPANGLRIFGTFQWIVDGKVQSISGFSPLLKQIFTYLLLSSIKNDQGVPVAQFTETFWPGFPADKAKDNRGTNVKRLRKILQAFDGIDIVYHEKKWRIEVSNDLFVDIKTFGQYRLQIKEQLANKALNLKDVRFLLLLLQPGNILQNTHAEWLDPYKNQVTEEVIDLLMSIYDDVKSDTNKEINCQLAKTILQFDQLNEFALKVLVKELANAGKHGMAKDEYNRFCKHYAALYGEDFSMNYQQLTD